MNRLSSSVRGHGPLLCLTFLSLALAGCGGGGSSSGPTGPTLTSVSPGYTAVGATSQAIETIGTGFTTASTLDWNGTVLVTTYVSATELKATIPSGDLAQAGQYPVTAVDAGIASNTIQYRVDGPLTASALSPATANVGSPTTQLTVTGTGFVPDSVVEWNGTALATTFVSVTQLQAAIPAADLATLGTGAITISNPTENKAITFQPLDFAVGYTMVTLQQGINDMVWDPSAQLIYASAGNTANTDANDLLFIDPNTGTIKSTLSAGNDPDVLAISDDSQFLYVGLDGIGTVQRFILPAFTPDISVPLGSTCFGTCFALALAVAPGAPHTFAVSRGALSETPATQGPVSIFDDSTARGTTVGQPPNYIFNLQWGASANVLYSGDGDITSYEFYNMTVNSGGVSIANEYSNVFGSNFTTIHYDSGTNLVYADNGKVVDPGTGTVVNSFSLPVSFAVMVPDSANGKAFFAYEKLNTATRVYDIVIQSFDLTTYAPIAQFTLPGAAIEGFPEKIIRWGTSGLAIKQGPGGTGSIDVLIINSSTLVN